MMTDAEWDDRLDMLFKQQRSDIGRYGFSSVGVFPTVDDDDQYGFTYTVGMSEQQRPELIVTGIGAAQAHRLLHAVNNAWDDMDPQIGVPFLLGDQGALVVLAPVPHLHAVTHFTMSYRHAPDPQILTAQILWTDDEDRWPWEDGHLRTTGPDYEASMPIFAGDSWRPAETA